MFPPEWRRCRARTAAQLQENPQSSTPGSPIQTPPHAAEAPTKASAAQPWGGGGDGGREGVGARTPPLLTCHAGRARAQAQGRRSHAESAPRPPPLCLCRGFLLPPALIHSRPDPGFRPGLPQPSHDKGAESGAGRHVTTRRRRLMTPEPALAVSATEEGS